MTPIARLFAVPHGESEIVAARAGQRIDWNTFAHDVAGLATRISSSGSHRWLVADADAYALAVGVLAALQAECQPMLPANLQHGHLADLAATADGMISSTEPLPGATNWLQTFDSTSSGDVSWLHPLDSAKAEIILHTSGTTGIPVAVHKPLRCLEAEVSDVAETFSPEPGRMTLATVPPYHIYGFIYRVLWPLSTNRPFFADMISYPEELISAAEENSGGMLVSSPAFLRRALPVLDLDHLKNFLGPVLSSGGPLPPAVAAAYNAVLSQPVYEIYGSTETGGIAFRSVTDADAPAHWQPLPSVEVALDSKQEVLAVRSPMLPGNDWALSSDTVRLHSDGRFELKGRADRVVKIEEKRVSLPEVEHRLNECPTVEAARVVALAGEDNNRQILGAVIEPSIAGWEMLANAGRQSLRSLLLDALNPYLATIILPRKWRFVMRIPEDDRGKTSDAALAALFDENQGRRVEPEIVGRELEQDSVILHLHLPKDLFYFDGHFDEAPILAGVVQIDWAIGYAMEHFTIPEGFRRIEALKFFKVLMAGEDVKLDLRYDRAAGCLKFQYDGAETIHSSGRIVFEASP
ncbi:MAG: AMP-binding protein [Proteobacteria bacterium]|nr:AMP-binding protein [Pseudomonadota bacterium]